MPKSPPRRRSPDRRTMPGSGQGTHADAAVVWFGKQAAHKTPAELLRHSIAPRPVTVSTITDVQWFLIGQLCIEVEVLIGYESLNQKSASSFKMPPVHITPFAGHPTQAIHPPKEYFAEGHSTGSPLPVHSDPAGQGRWLILSTVKLPSPTS